MRSQARAVTLRMRQGDILGRHELAGAVEHVAVRIHALGRFAHDDEVHRGAAMRHAGAGAGGADIGVEVELDAELGRDVDAAFVARRVVEMRDRPEDDAVDFAGAGENAVRHGGAVRLVSLEADVAELVGDAEPEAVADRIEHGDGRLGDLRTDPVAGQNQ